MTTYHRTLGGLIRLELEDGRAIEFDGEGENYYAVTMRDEIEAGTATVLDPPPPPEPEPTRDDRLLDAVEKANTGVDTVLDATSDFTAKQKAILKTLLKGAFGQLAQAIRGE